MKLYILINTISNEILAITEFKYHIYSFYLQNEYSNDEYKIVKLTDKNKINNYLILLDDLYLIEFYNFFIRVKDKTIIMNMINDNISKLTETIEYLEHILSDFNVSNKESINIDKTISILKKNSKSSNIIDFIDIKNIIRDYYNIPSLQKTLTELQNRFEYNVDY